MLRRFCIDAHIVGPPVQDSYLHFVKRWRHSAQLQCLVFAYQRNMCISPPTCMITLLRVHILPYVDSSETRLGAVVQSWHRYLVRTVLSLSIWRHYCSFSALVLSVLHERK